MRIKVYLSMLWLSAASPYTSRFPSAFWAQLLDLPDPYGRGSRRVNAALSWLVAERYVTVDDDSVRPRSLQLLSDAGDGMPYKHPFDARQPYIQLPQAFWTAQWIASLSGTAVAMLVILTDLATFPPLRSVRSYTRDKVAPTDEPIWISPRLARELYAVSEDTWATGTTELERNGLVVISKSRVDKDIFDWRRVRNQYSLRWERLRWSDLDERFE